MTAPTGWPPGMLQDDSRELSRALSSKPGARMHVRDVAAKITEERTMTDTTELRAAFEKWALDEAGYSTAMLPSGVYANVSTYVGWNVWQAAHASARNVPETPKEDLAQNWAGMDGATAFHLIERHADGWGDVGYMMEQWRAANASATQQHEGLRKDADRLDWLEDQAKKSRTGLTLSYTRPFDGEGGYRVMRYHSIGEFHATAREAIDAHRAALSVAGDKT